MGSPAVYEFPMQTVKVTNVIGIEDSLMGGSILKLLEIGIP